MTDALNLQHSKLFLDFILVKVTCLLFPLLQYSQRVSSSSLFFFLFYFLHRFCIFVFNKGRSGFLEFLLQQQGLNFRSAERKSVCRLHGNHSSIMSGTKRHQEWRYKNPCIVLINTFYLPLFNHTLRTYAPCLNNYSSSISFDRG